MARPASVAIAGYYPTPERLLPLIASMVAVPPVTERKANDYSRPVYRVCDPCAGDGSALAALAGAWFGDKQHDAELYGCELEATRAKALQERTWLHPGAYRSRGNFLHGDAFRVVWSTRSGVDLLYLNPPYDVDYEYKRLEQRWLSRFTSFLTPSTGVLLFVVPRYALSASAVFLATHYEHIQCFQFPSPDFEVFKQVVLVARRMAMPDAHPSQVQIDRISGFADGGELPIIGSCSASLSFPVRTNSSVYEWKVAPVDLSRVRASVRGWCASSKTTGMAPIASVPFARPVMDLMGRPFPVAMPPRPAHIALALAAGLLNGSRIEPDDQGKGFPSLLVKGVFDREYKTVEEKKDKDGNVKTIVQVQHPVLRVTVLDLATSTYHSIATGSEPTNASDVSLFNVADLVIQYRKSLLLVLYQQCPPLHSFDKGQIALPPMSRELFSAQAQGAQAAIKLIAKGENPFILGEVGVGKTSVAACALEALSLWNIERTRQGLLSAGIESKNLKTVWRALVLCPPHLLQGWEDQLNACIPGARVLRLETISDVEKAGAPFSSEHNERAAGLPGFGLTVAILSRETAKLGHPYEAVSGNRCPACNSPFSRSADEVARLRSCCGASLYRPANGPARLAVKLAECLASYIPKSEVVRRLVPGRFMARMKQREWTEKGQEAVVGLFQEINESMELANRAEADILFRLASAVGPEIRQWLIAMRVERLLSKEIQYADSEELGRYLNLSCPVEAEVAQYVMAKASARSSYWGWSGKVADLAQQAKAFATDGELYSSDKLKISMGRMVYDGELVGSIAHAEKALRLLEQAGTWHKQTCTSELYQAVPRPRRYPLATYISRRHPRLFDMLVLDEVQEYSADGSAQERAAHRLSGLGMPTISLTGSVMNGYASSLFQNFWALSPKFKEEFGSEDRSAFVQRYGYRKQAIDVTGSDKARARGVVTDRREQDIAVIRQLGEAPGVLPLFVLHHLLPVAVIMHKADLEQELPPCTETMEVIGLEEGIGPELKARYDDLKKKTLEQIKKDRFTPERAGRLWGALGTLPSFLDRCTVDTGSEGDPRCFAVRYPEVLGSELVAAAECFPSSVLTPKEEWLMATLEREFDEGRNVILFVWHTGTKNGLVQRLTRLIKEKTGEVAAVLDAAKVGTAKRQAWIDKELVGKQRKVLIVNPVAVQTGLNNLVYCSTAIWYENPACNAIVYRQANGRLDRIGQTEPVRILFPVYEGTAQSLAHGLLLRKVAVSLQTDGLDAQSALEAAGAGVEDTLRDSFTFGKALFESLTQGED